MKIQKLSEKTLGEVLETMFPKAKITKQSALFSFRIDYKLELEGKEFFFEFDGPYHFTRAKTQTRDFIVERELGESLIRIPYFIQLNQKTVASLFPKFLQERISEEIDSEYKSGFYDDGIVLPGDFNRKGLNIFYSVLNKLSPSCLEEVQNSLLIHKRKDFVLEEIFGIDYEDCSETSRFIGEFYNE